MIDYSLHEVTEAVTLFDKLYVWLRHRETGKLTLDRVQPQRPEPHPELSPFQRTVAALREGRL
jgi:hypothetical protein